MEISAYRDIERLALSRLMSQSDGFERSGEAPWNGKKYNMRAHTTNVAACHELVGPNASLPKSIVIY